MPANAASLSADLNLEISPISDKMTAPKVTPIPGIEVIGDAISNLHRHHKDHQFQMCF